MEVKAIQGLSLINQNAGSLKKSDNHSAVKNYAQMDAPMSKNAAEAIKNNSMVSFGEKKKKSNPLKTAAVATVIGMAAGPAVTSCNPIKVEADAWAESHAEANSWAWTISDCSCNNKPDTMKTVIHDTIYGKPVIIPGDTIKGETVYLPGDTVKGATVILPGDTVKGKTVYLPGDTIKGATVYLPGDTIKGADVIIPGDTIKGETVYIPGDTIKGADVILPGDTIKEKPIVIPGDTIKGDPVVIRDTSIITRIDTLHFKDYPFHIADSLIAHGLNNGFKLNGPEPTSTNNNIVFLASSCYNRYDQKMYQTYAVDDPDANTSKMATLITRVTDLYDKNNPKVSYIKSVVTDVPGKGIQFEYTQIPENRVSSIEAQDNEYLPSPFDYRFMQAGKEIHTNLRNGTNRVTILNSKGEEEWRGDFKKGQLPQTFFFQTFARDPRTGEVYYDENGNPEQAKYDFSNGQMISRAVEWTEYQPGYVKPNLH